MLVVVNKVRDNKGGAIVPWEVAQGVEIRVQTHIGVSGIPRGDVIALNGIHIHIYRQEVITSLGAILDGVRNEEGRVDALALQSPLHICRTDHDGVDLAASYICLQLLQGERHF